jgi:hypothetical protein
MTFFVICGACNTEHYKEDVEELDIEEGPMGEDVLTFWCHEKDTVQKSIVYGSPYN